MNSPSQTSSNTKRTDSLPARRVDAHHHLWRYCAPEFRWIGDDMAELRRNFLIDDLRPELQAAKIDATVVVQARESIEETHWLLECARAAPFLGGVVGWAPLEANDLAEILSAFSLANNLVGLREIVQGKADGYLDRPEFNRGVRELTRLNLAYDVLIHEGQLIEATRLVDRHPDQRFVLDHAGKPKISKDELEPWKKNIQELAHRPNVVCKLSGLVTEGNWRDWTLESMRPYLDVCVEAFGPGRLLAGSDWPVCLVACEYVRWWDVLTLYFADFSEDEAGCILGENAIEFYHLSGIQRPHLE